MSSTLHPMLNVAVRAARAAGAIINRAALDVEVVRVAQKQVNDFVTEVDQASEDAIIETLLTAYPGHGILAEESGRAHGNANSEHLWIIDPLDGTTNFIHGFPVYCVSIALQVAGRMEQAVVYDPTRNDLFTATRGRGAYLNDRRMRVGKRTRLADCLIATGFPFRPGDDFPTYLKMMGRMMSATAGLRRPGAAALDLAYVAAGFSDGFFETGLKPWDVAAGSLLVTEAGGLVGNFMGDALQLDLPECLAANPRVYAQMVNMLAPYSQAARLPAASASSPAPRDDAPPAPEPAHVAPAPAWADETDEADETDAPEDVVATAEEAVPVQTPVEPPRDDEAAANEQAEIEDGGETETETEAAAQDDLEADAETEIEAQAEDESTEPSEDDLVQMDPDAETPMPSDTAAPQPEPAEPARPRLRAAPQAPEDSAERRPFRPDRGPRFGPGAQGGADKPMRRKPSDAYGRERPYGDRPYNDRPYGKPAYGKPSARFGGGARQDERPRYDKPAARFGQPSARPDDRRRYDPSAPGGDRPFRDRPPRPFSPRPPASRPFADDRPRAPAGRYDPRPRRDDDAPRGRPYAPRDRDTSYPPRGRPYPPRDQPYAPRDGNRPARPQTRGAPPSRPAFGNAPRGKPYTPRGPRRDA